MDKLSHVNRETKIATLRNYFRLDFRVPEAYAANLSKDFATAAEAYDEAVSNCNVVDESLLAEYYADFQALDALDVFYELCLDYYQDELTGLRQRMRQHQKILNLYQNDNPEIIAQMKPKALRHYEQIRTRCQERINAGCELALILKAQIKDYKQKLAAVRAQQLTNNQSQ